jgi:hypothetical protein
MPTEKERIDKMVQEGKISEEEAHKLLVALAAEQATTSNAPAERERKKHRLSMVAFLFSLAGMLCLPIGIGFGAVLDETMNSVKSDSSAADLLEFLTAGFFLASPCFGLIGFVTGLISCGQSKRMANNTGVGLSRAAWILGVLDVAICLSLIFSLGVRYEPAVRPLAFPSERIPPVSE